MNITEDQNKLIENFIKYEITLSQSNNRMLKNISFAYIMSNIMLLIALNEIYMRVNNISILFAFCVSGLLICTLWTQSINETYILIKGNYKSIYKYGQILYGKEKNDNGKNETSIILHRLSILLFMIIYIILAEYNVISFLIFPTS